MVVGCGSDEAPDPGPAPQLDPPQAAEPVTAPPVEGTPPGRIVEVGETPEGVAISDGLVGVAVDGPPRLALVDLETGEAVREVPLPGSARHLVAADGEFLVPVEGADQLLQVGEDGSAVRVAVGDGPHDVAKLGDRIFTADEFGSTLSVVRDGELVGQVPVDAQPGGLAVIGERVAVAAVRAYTVELYDGLSDEPRGAGGQSAGLGPSHVVAAGDRLAIADTRGQALMVFGVTDRMRYERRIELSGTPVGIATGDGDSVWVALSERNEVVEVNVAEGSIGRRVETVRNPYTVAYDGGTLAIASQSDGTVQLVRPG